MQQSTEPKTTVDHSVDITDPHRARRPDALDVKIGLALKHRRQSANLSQQALAKKCQLSFQQIQKYESGANRIPASRLFVLATALKTSPTELLQAAWVAQSGNHDDLLRDQLERAVAQLSGAELQALVTLAERLSTPTLRA